MWLNMGKAFVYIRTFIIYAKPVYRYNLVPEKCPFENWRPGSGSSPSSKNANIFRIILSISIA